MLRDSAYWDEFYSLEHDEIKEPSKFAKFIFNNFLRNKNKASLIEFGCGNGRDSLYFNAKGIDVVAIDGSHIAIESLQKQNQKASWICGDFSAPLNLKDKFDICYSRFTLHAIDDIAELGLIKNVKNLLKPDGFFVVEARSINDDKFGIGEAVGEREFISDGHYRRFIDQDIFKANLIQNGFKIVDIDESSEFAPTPGQNCVCIRVIASL